MSSGLASLNQGLEPQLMGQVSPYISAQGTCTVTGFASPPFTPGNDNLIICLSTQKNVLLGSSSGGSKCTTCTFKWMFQWEEALSPPVDDGLELLLFSMLANLALISAKGCHNNISYVCAMFVICGLLYVPKFTFFVPCCQPFLSLDNNRCLVIIVFILLRQNSQ